MNRKSLLITILALMILSSSCKVTRSIYPVNTHEIDIASRNITKFEFISTLSLKSNHAIFYSEMLDAAKNEHGDNITIGNIRILNRGSHYHEVLFDVYQYPKLNNQNSAVSPTIIENEIAISPTIIENIIAIPYGEKLSDAIVKKVKFQVLLPDSVICRRYRVSERMNYQECKTQISNLIKDMQDDTYSLLTIEDLESLKNLVDTNPKYQSLREIDWIWSSTYGANDGEMYCYNFFTHQRASMLVDEKASFLCIKLKKY